MRAMHLVALLSWPSPIEKAIASLAEVLELAPYEARTRLTGDAPRLVTTLADRVRAEACASELSSRGFAATVVDASTIEHDADRDIVTAIEIGPESLRASLRGGGERTVRWDSISLMLHGVRALSSTTIAEQKVSKFSAGRALMTGGLILSKTTTTTESKTTESRESFVYLYEAGARPAIALYERRTNWSFLGAKLQPSAAANFAHVLGEIRRHAPHTRFDNRLTRPFSIGAVPLSPPGLDAAEWKLDVAVALLSLTA